MEDDNQKNLRIIRLGSLGSVTVTQLHPESTEVYAKFPSTPTMLCANGVDNRGTGGANLNDDAPCPMVS